MATINKKNKKKTVICFNMKWNSVQLVLTQTNLHVTTVYFLQPGNLLRARVVICATSGCNLLNIKKKNKSGFFHRIQNLCKPQAFDSVVESWHFVTWFRMGKTTWQNIPVDEPGARIARITLTLIQTESIHQMGKKLY